MKRRRDLVTTGAVEIRGYSQENSRSAGVNGRRRKGPSGGFAAVRGAAPEGGPYAPSGAASRRRRGGSVESHEWWSPSSRGRDESSGWTSSSAPAITSSRSPRFGTESSSVTSQGISRCLRTMDSDARSTSRSGLGRRGACDRSPPRPLPLTPKPRARDEGISARDSPLRPEREHARYWRCPPPRPGEVAMARPRSFPVRLAQRHCEPLEQWAAPQAWTTIMRVFVDDEAP
jgi:hypothetical protein